MSLKGIFRRGVAALLIALTCGLSPVSAQPLNYRVSILRSGGLPAGTGDPTALRITSAIWTTTSDLLPSTQFIDGWTGDLTLNAVTPAGATSAYAVGTQASPKLSFTRTYPGYNSSAATTTGTDTIYATSWLRQTYSNGTLPTEAANGGNAKIALAFNDRVYASDSLGTATSLSGLYTSGAVVSTAKAGIPITNASSAAYPRPIGVWVTPPGERIGSNGATVEFFGGQSYAQGGVPLAAVVITACDAGAAHCAAKTISTPTVSVRQVQASCTGTNGSNVLTSCSDTSAFIVGQRVTVPGIPGQPRLSAKTSTTLTFSSAQTCVTTLNSGTVTINGTPTNKGDGLADGAFVGATITDANFTTPAGVATITAQPATAGVTTVSQRTTAVTLVTDATVVTAEAGGHACTINHLYQGTTGTVTATVGNPVPVYAAVFSSGDLSTLTDGLVYFRAQAYATKGDVVLDTQTGADGTGCDWFYKNVNGGVCNSSSAAWFNTNGTDISPNLHNLWAYLDTAGTYVPAYNWIKSTGTCTTNACVSTSPTDPGGGVGNYAATPFQAQANIKSWYNANKSHNDPMGGVICCTAGTYTGFGGNMSTALVALKPPMILTSALAGGDCPVTGAANSDLVNTILNRSTTAANNTAGSGIRYRNFTMGDANILLSGPDGTLTTSFNTHSNVFEGDLIRPTAGVANFNKIGVWRIYNSLVDEQFEGRILQPASTSTASLALLFGTTAFCGSYADASGSPKAQYYHYNSLGNTTWACEAAEPTGLQTIAYNTQPISQVMGFNRWMGMNGGKLAWVGSNNLLLTTNIVELMNSGTSPAMQVSGDSANLPMTNVAMHYNTVLGGRTNNIYLEGVPIKGTAVASGGSFAAGTYYTQVTFSLVGNPTVETSTDGINVTAGTFSGTTLVLNGSMNVALPCDANYVANIHVGLVGDITGAGSSASLGHYGVVSGADSKQLAMCQTVVVTAQGSAHSAISVAGSTAHNELKSLFFERFNIWNNYNMKGDYFGGTTGQAGSVASGGKIGSWGGRYRVGWLGNTMVSGTVVGGATPQYDSGIGDVLAYLDNVNPTNTAADISWVKYRSDRSFGSGATTTPTSPGTNIGWGDYHIDTSVTNPVGVVPTGLAAWPWDIEGTARKSGSGACGGAFEC